MGFDEHGNIRIDVNRAHGRGARADGSRGGYGRSSSSNDWNGYFQEMGKWSRRRFGAFVSGLSRGTIIATACAALLTLVLIVGAGSFFPVAEKPLPMTGGNVTKSQLSLDEEGMKSASGRVFVGMSSETVAELAGMLAYYDYRESGILASVTAAQFLWNSKADEVPTDLARYYSNAFALEATMQDAGWEGSTWQGKAVNLEYQKYLDGDWVVGTAPFRVYITLWDSVKDYSAYLTHVTNEDGSLKFPDADKIRDPDQLIDLLAAGGYSTDPDYAAEMKALISEYNLTRFDHI